MELGLVLGVITSACEYATGSAARELPHGRSQRRRDPRGIGGPHRRRGNPRSPQGRAWRGKGVALIPPPRGAGLTGKPGSPRPGTTFPGKPRGPQLTHFPARHGLARPPAPGRLLPADWGVGGERRREEAELAAAVCRRRCWAPRQRAPPGFVRPPWTSRRGPASSSATTTRELAALRGSGLWRRLQRPETGRLRRGRPELSTASRGSCTSCSTNGPASRWREPSGRWSGRSCR